MRRTPGSAGDGDADEVALGEEQHDPQRLGPTFRRDLRRHLGDGQAGLGRDRLHHPVEAVAGRQVGEGVAEGAGVAAGFGDRGRVGTREMQPVVLAEQPGGKGPEQVVGVGRAQVRDGIPRRGGARRLFAFSSLS